MLNREPLRPDRKPLADNSCCSGVNVNFKSLIRCDGRRFAVVAALVAIAAVSLLSRPIWAVPQAGAAQQPGVSAETQVQLLHQEERHAVGQPVRPVYEGWAPIPDKPGMVNMYFGYMNVNWDEEPEIPIGPNNAFTPGVDQGQPTHFLTRRHMNNFYFAVPRDFKGTYTWSITVHGITQTAVGSLDPVKQIDTFRRTEDGNTPLRSSRSETQNVTAKLSSPATLMLNVTDDGLPNYDRAPKGGWGGRCGSADVKPMTPASALILRSQRGFRRGHA